MRAQTWGDKVQPKNKDWTECVFVCARVRHTSAFLESIRPFAPSANIWECDNCRECENILCTGRLRLGSGNPHGCFTNTWPFCDHGVRGDRQGKDSWRVFFFFWRTFQQVSVDGGWKAAADREWAEKMTVKHRQNCAFICVLSRQSQTLYYMRPLCSEPNFSDAQVLQKVKTHFFFCQRELIHVVRLVADCSSGCASFLSWYN